MKSKCWQRGTVKPSTCLGKREGSHPHNLAIASLQDSCCEEGLVGEVNLGADHSLIESSEGLCFRLLLLFIPVIGALAGSAPPLVLS